MTTRIVDLDRIHTCLSRLRSGETARDQARETLVECGVSDYSVDGVIDAAVADLYYEFYDDSDEEQAVVGSE